MSRFKIGVRVQLTHGCHYEKYSRGDGGIIRGLKRIDPGFGGYTEYDVELTDGRVVGLCSWEMNAMPDPLGETQLAMELEAA